MKCPIIFCEKKKIRKTSLVLSSAESAQSVLSVKLHRPDIRTLKVNGQTSNRMHS